MVQGFCPLKIKITQFADGFRLNNYHHPCLKNPPISCSITGYTPVQTSSHLTITYTAVGQQVIKGSCSLLMTGLS